MDTLTPRRSLAITSFFVAVTVLLSGCGTNLVDRLQSPFGYGFCGLLIVILDVIALIELFGSDRSTGDKVIWALFIIFAPILGCVVYYLFARR